MEIHMSAITVRRLKKLVKHDAETLKERGYGDGSVIVMLGGVKCHLLDVSISDDGTTLILTAGDHLLLAPRA